MEGAAAVGEGEVDVGEVGAVRSQPRTVGLGLECEGCGGRRDRESAGLLAAPVGDHGNLARLVGGLERRAEPLDGRGTDGRTVDEQFDLVRVAVDLDRDGLAFAAAPGPVLDRVAPRPRRRDRDRAAVVGRRVDRDVRVGAQAEDDLPEVGDGPAVCR